jgi:hypothetical protein
MSALSSLLSRKDTILSELAAMSSQPTYSIDGQWVDHTAHRQALLNELEKLSELIAMEEGPLEAGMRGA